MSVNLFDQYFSSGFLDINEGEKTEKHLQQLFHHNYWRFLPDNKNVTIVDVGCGTGSAVAWLLKKGYKNSSGIDISKEIVAYGKKRKLPVALVIDLLAWTKKNKGKFDMIFMNDVIEHLPKEQIVDIVSGLYAALKPEGTMVVKTNNVSAITGARMRFWDFTHTTSFTEFSLGQVLYMAGCRYVKMYPFTFPLNKITRIARRWLQMIFHGLWKTVYWLEFTVVPKIVHEYFFAVIKKTKNKKST